MSEEQNIIWSYPEELATFIYVCGWCSCKVSSQMGIDSTIDIDIEGGHNPRIIRELYARIYICPGCKEPTIMHLYPVESESFTQTPIGQVGKDIKGLNEGVSQAYEDARKCLSINAWAAAAMLCRKMLMDIAVSKGADENMTFVKYVNYLLKNGYIPPNLEELANEVRDTGNKANHEVEPITKADAESVFEIMEHLLQGIYDLPHKANQRKKTKAAQTEENKS